jgi:hypothetical protein
MVTSEIRKSLISRVTIWLPFNIIEDKLRLKKKHGSHLGTRKRERFHGNIEILHVKNQITDEISLSNSD